MQVGWGWDGPNTSPESWFGFSYANIKQCGPVQGMQGAKWGGLADKNKSIFLDGVLAPGAFCHLFVLASYV